MATARCGALPVIKVLATLQSEECKISCTCALAVLSTHQACRQIIIQERAASVLVLLSQSTEKKTVVGAIKALSCLSFYPNLRSALVDAGAVSALMCIILSGKFIDDLQGDIARTLCYLAHSKETRQEMVQSKAVCGLVVICARSDRSITIERFCALSLQRFSWSKESHLSLLVDGGIDIIVKLMHRACDTYDAETFGLVICDCMTALANLSSSMELLEGLLEAQVVEALTRVVERESIKDDVEAVWRVSYTLFHLSQIAAHRSDLGARGITRPLVDLLEYGNSASKQCCAAALCNLSKEKSIRGKMVEQGALPRLISLSESKNRITKQWCAIAIANLSAQSKLSNGTVAALLKMSAEEDRTGETSQNASLPLPSVIQRSQDGKKHLQSYVHLGNSSHLHQQQLDRTTNRLVNASKQDGQLIAMPPAVHTHLGSDDEHKEYSTRVIDQLVQPQKVQKVKATGGLACKEMRPPRPMKMKKVRFEESEELRVTPNLDSALAAPFSGSDGAIQLHLPKIVRVPDLTPIFYKNEVEPTKKETHPKAANKPSKPRVSSILVTESSKKR